MLRSCTHLVLIAATLMLAGCGPTAFRVELVPAGPQLQQTTIETPARLLTFDKIAVIDVDGFLANRRKRSLLTAGENPVSLFREKLDAAAADPRVKAVVLRINSPGGTVAASDVMYHSLIQFKQQTDKPVVAAIMTVGASGGYMIACGADAVYAQPGSVTGSIGTIMQTVSLEGTLEKIGIDTVAIKSGPMKDMASPLHDLREEERQILQGIIDHFYQNFLAVVKMRRPIDPDQLDKIADGRVFTSEQALDYKLIDRIGYPDDAINHAKQLAGINDARVVIYHRLADYMPNIYGSAAAQTDMTAALVNVDLPDWLDSPSAHFLYLWQPMADSD